MQERSTHTLSAPQELPEPAIPLPESPHPSANGMIDKNAATPSRRPSFRVIVLTERILTEAPRSEEALYGK
jgi:hypothetical protein